LFILTAVIRHALDELLAIAGLIAENQVIFHSRDEGFA
jgi:hypothetical protein